MKTLLTILITSLFWAIGLYFYENFAEESARDDESVEMVQKAEPVAKAEQPKLTTPTKPKAEQPKPQTTAKPKVEQPKPQTTAKPKAEQPKPIASTKPKVEQPKQTPAPKAAVKNYAELICGYWKPVEGNQYPLEISKYGTVVQWMVYSSGDKYERSRESYTISGNKLNIDDGYYKCAVEVLNEGGATYLEVYGHEKYAGKYRLRK